ncbi:MAG: DUF6588 family protein [bacterium]
MGPVRTIRVLMVIFSLFASLCHAQIDNVQDLMRSGVDDATLLLKAYLTPFGNGFGADLNSGWATSARTHRVLGFDITVSANAAIAPESEKLFDITALGLQNLRLVANENPLTPSVVGDDDPGPEVAVILNNPFTGQDEIVTTFRMPQGVGFRYVPSPMVQAAIGVPLNTDVIIRYFPEITFDNDVGRMKMGGIGIKHELNQWLPGGNMLPFDLAVLLGVTTFQAEADLEVNPDPQAIQTGASYDFQQVDIEATAFAFNIMISKKLAVLTLFGGVGIESSSLDIKLEGRFPVTLIETEPLSPNFGKTVIVDFEDPVHLSFNGANSARANVGVQLELAILSAYLSYTFSEYPVATAGIGFTLR